MSKNSKAYREAAEKIDRDQLYTPLEAAKLAKETSSKKQDATVEVAIRLGVDPRKADQMVRGTVNLPHGTGKTARVAVFAVGDKAEEATAAGADEVGSDDLIEKIQGGFLDFDAAIATPDQMAKVGRIARILGPRGLMPNPKTGTVTARRHQGGQRHQGRQDQLPRRQAGQPALRHRQGVVRREVAGRELRRRARRDPAGQAVVVEGPLPEEDRRLDDHRPGHPRRPGGHPQLRRGLSPSNVKLSRTFRRSVCINFTLALAVAVAPVAGAEPATAAQAGFVDIRSVIPDAVVDLRYATADNFVGKPLYPADARCLVHESLAPGLAKAADAFRARGAKLVFWDCYRPHAVQVEMFEAVPDPNWVARPGTSARSHESGRSVDVTLADAHYGWLDRHGHRLRRLLATRKGFRHRRRHRRAAGQQEMAARRDERRRAFGVLGRVVALRRPRRRRGPADPRRPAELTRSRASVVAITAFGRQLR